MTAVDINSSSGYLCFIFRSVPASATCDPRSKHIVMIQEGTTTTTTTTATTTTNTTTTTTNTTTTTTYYYMIPVSYTHLTLPTIYTV